MSVTISLDLILAQQGGSAYMVGQVVGVIFLVVLVIAVLRSILKKK